MATDLEYAMMAGHAYISTRNPANTIPVSGGYTEFAATTKASGFEAVSFAKGGEIVISFAGTNQGTDWLTNAALGVGLNSDQLRDAALYYAQIKAANPTATITFTGHSLGGGLAALMGVLFNEKATTFDAAPFNLSLSESTAADLRSHLAANGFSTGAAVNNLNGYSDASRATREAGVKGYYVEGEALALATDTLPFVEHIGAQTVIYHGGASLGEAVNLHSQAFTVAFMQSDAFRQATYKVPDAVAMASNADLFGGGVAVNNPVAGFLEHMIRHQTGVTNPSTGATVVTADNMLNRYASDLQKVGQDGGLSKTNNALTKTLTAFAMQMYYENPVATSSTKTLFDAAGVTAGGIHFKRSDVAANLTDAKGYNLYFGDYLNSLPATERAEMSSPAKLAAIGDWYIQSGTSAMTATAAASTTGALMLGGTGSDKLTGSSYNDMIYGGSGNDTIAGGAGNDVLLGGDGNDSIDGGTGNDTMYGGSGNDTYVVNSTADYVSESGGSGIDTVQASVSYTAGSGIENVTLTGSSALSATGNDADNTLTGNTGANVLTGGAGNDQLVGGKGNDTLYGGTGNDTYVFAAGAGKDTVADKDTYIISQSSDKAVFTGARSDQLWFQHVGNDLVVSTIGTTDAVTIKDWYSHGTGGTLWNAYTKQDTHVEKFTAADGKVLVDSQVENLVQAMASFAPPAAGQTSLPANYQTALSTVIAANWKTG